MKVLHINAGAEDGGGKTHIISLLAEFPKNEVDLLVFEEGPVASDARKLGIHVHVLGQKNRYDLSILSRLTNFINEGKYEIVHTHGPRANLFVAAIKKKITARWVSTIHSNPLLDFGQSSLKDRVFTGLNFFSFRKMDMILAITEKIKKVLASKGIDENKIDVIYNGINFDEQPAEPLDQKSTFEINGDIFTIVHVARLHPIKGHEVLFEALTKIEKEDVKVLLVGDGPLAADLKAKSEQMGISNKLNFLGFRDNVNRIIASSHIGILTSHSEGFPIVLLEVANQHKTCITTDVSDVQQLIPDSSYGWIVPIGDADALAKAIEEAYDRWKNGEITEMGEKFYQRAKDQFSLRRLYADTRRYYRNALQTPR